MKHVTFQFHDDLNDFMPDERKGILFPYDFRGPQTVKHLIESLGVPHIEVGRIVMNGTATSFDYLVQDGDNIHVFPISHSDEDNQPLSRLCPLGEHRFVLDNHLGRLAYLLRMIGMDTLYQNDYQDTALAQIASQGERILLTRDRRLLMRNAVRYGYWVRSKNPRVQLVEVMRRFNLEGEIVRFYRCMRCNGILQSVQKEEILPRLLPLTRRYIHEFRICPDCKQIYWYGSHCEHMNELIDQALREIHSLHKS
ncbi:MAG: Mut7-C ubiquitin/RNAse domain-containing protein [Anaerolineales bacterium]|nr:Mut7-C ubiquitin/RNAse domain-containing protein [Anaerolineales bacterium]